ncbi:hypothetical protein E2C01_045779 [Portunus trituberculatus]|uniref:Uncharacterized protein n=1 Tax=Portunus trituberculatus TaxID=210409 RepID=A0A5B7FZ69_PORTR|nr:hypothetical protein [Portunus trituberculatus]
MRGSTADSIGSARHRTGRRSTRWEFLKSRRTKRVPQLTDRWELHCSFLFPCLICSTPVEDIVPEENVDNLLEAEEVQVYDDCP